MSDLTLLVLRVAFLALLWVFVFAVVYALRSDLFGGPERRTREPQPAAVVPVGVPAAVQSLPTAPVTPSGGLRPPQQPHAATQLVITSGPRAGTTVELGTEPLTIGRSSDSGLQIRDDYTSTHHARLLLWGADWVVQDLDSTNGTFVGGERIDSPTQVPIGMPVKVGATSFELRA